VKSRNSQSADSPPPPPLAPCYGTYKVNNFQLSQVNTLPMQRAEPRQMDEWHASVCRVFPRSAPERTLQASGQGHAIARPKGGPPCCSAPESSTRWAVSGVSLLMKANCVGLYQRQAHTRARMQLNEIPGKEIPGKYRPSARARYTIVYNTDPEFSLGPGSRQKFIFWLLQVLKPGGE
jgi:hypothetical protein